MTDHLGTVRDLIGASCALINHIDYDSFGNVIAETSSTYGDRIKFTGRELDAETGLYYYRAHYYDPSTGRFISQDPISFDAGDTNLYRYVGNRPLIAADPSGQTEFAFSAGALAYDLKLAETVNGYTFGYTCGWLDAFYRGDPNPTASAMQAAIVGMATGLTLSAVPVKYALIASVAFALAGVNSIAEAAAQGNEPLFAIRTICFTAPLARTLVRGFTSTPQLKFGNNDLVYGPSANGALRNLQQTAGGRMLTDLPKPQGMSWKAFSAQTMETALKNGDKIHFDMTNMKDIPNILQGKGPFANSTTAFEMNYLQANWSRFSSNVSFYLNGAKVSAPW